MTPMTSPAASVMPRVLRLDDPNGTRGTLLATRCEACGATNVGLDFSCRNCASRHVCAIECAGLGTLVNYTIVHRAAASWPGAVPYVLGVVTLPEAVELTGEVVDARAEDLRPGMPVELALREGGRDPDGRRLIVHKWRPASPADGRGA